MENNISAALALGQSIWLDFINREIINNGDLKKMIESDGIRGITSNPAIFEKAITGGNDYDEDIAHHTEESTEELFFDLAISDIRKAAGLLEPVYKQSNGSDGFVSLEVSPKLARDTNATIQQARMLWHKLDRKNVMIKIPGTTEGLPAIQQCINDGININITLLFSIDRYKAVTEAYITGLEHRLERGDDISDISSVASFFLSRIDTLIDPILAENNLEALQGKTAIASAKLAYQVYLRTFSTDRWLALEQKGAKKQRLLWASTSSKNKAYKDTMYIDALIGENTVNTIPQETLKAFIDHGHPAALLEKDVDKATAVLGQIKTAGISIDNITDQLEEEGIKKFNEPFDQLLASIEKQKHSLQNATP